MSEVFKNKHIGVLYTDNMNSGLTHDFFSPIMDSFKINIERKGYIFSFINSEFGSKDGTSYLDQVHSNNMDGVFLINIDEISDKVTALFESEIPVVTIDYKTAGAISISSDNYNGMVEMIRYVYDMGHRKIAFLCADMDSEVARFRTKTFKDTCNELGLSIPKEYFMECNFRDMKMAGRRTEELFALSNPPTCIFYPDDYAAVGGINIIRARGFEVPHDISYCGYDGVNLVGYFEPSITTVQQDVVNIGKVAADTLMHLIENNLNGDGSEIIVPTKLIKGETVKQIYI